ncbi:headcase protein homolog [Watersipora subatra]|uniref:headcase protein homolog n=1 Tax=Watersipora subatra TaxID=2589382 RepID=UPI00355C0947
MPHAKSNRLKLAKQQSGDRFDFELPAAEQDDLDRQLSGADLQSPTGNENMVSCCNPRHCRSPLRLINKAHPAAAVKVCCNNEDCTQSDWMHKDCFDDWEEHVLVFLRTSGRARSWSDKQRVQNLWTKKGYDLAYKACECLCGKGHLRKDLNYMPSAEEELTEQKKPKHGHKKNEKPMPTVSARSQPIPVGSGRPRVQIRSRTMSLSSTGSSPPSGSSPDGSPTQTRPMGRSDGRFEFALTSEQASSGNIFYHRPDLQAFNKLPPQKRNPYHIKMEDEGPYGNDEIRCFVLSALSPKRITSLPCVVCGHELKIFDRYPLIDGTLFLTPQRYISNIDVRYHNQTQHLNAVCMMCAEGVLTELHCKQCNRQWDGSSLQVGTMYSYDIFAASPCCEKRLRCRSCQQPVIDPLCNMPFSQFSRAHACQQCHVTAYHFVRPLSEIFYIQRR